MGGLINLRQKIKNGFIAKDNNNLVNIESDSEVH